jgi:hypothetical protein
MVRLLLKQFFQGIDHFLIMHVDVGFTFSEMFDFYLDITLPSVL